jgi:hypothetical protein
LVSLHARDVTAARQRRLPIAILVPVGVAPTLLERRPAPGLVGELRAPCPPDRVAAMASDDHDHEIKIKGGSFELSDLGLLMPGMAEIMPLVGTRIWKCYYAGKARNRALAAFQLKEAVNLMEKGAILRPKYAEDMDKFVSGIVGTVGKAIETQDWAAFEGAFETMIEQANAYHEQYDKGYLRWKIPSEPPPDLDMTPVD